MSVNQVSTNIIGAPAPQVTSQVTPQTNPVVNLENPIDTFSSSRPSLLTNTLKENFEERLADCQITSMKDVEQIYSQSEIKELESMGLLESLKKTPAAETAKEAVKWSKGKIAAVVGIGLAVVGAISAFLYHKNSEVEKAEK